MSEIEVRIVKLESMRVASAYGFGPSPEAMAHQKMENFLKAKGFLGGYGTKYPSFGFNNPNPSVGSPNYGYEIWVPVGSDVEPEDDIRIVEVPGGLYAVTRFEGLEKIGEVWRALVKWCENSAYRMSPRQCLENLLNPLETDLNKYVFDLYQPIAE